MRATLSKVVERSRLQSFRRAPLPRSYTDYVGREIFLLLLTVQGLAAFALITLGVLLRKFNTASGLIHPRMRQEVNRAGVALMPMFVFVSLALGFLVVGQTVSALARM